MPWKTDDYIDLLTPFQSGYSMGQMNRSRKLQEEQARIREAQVAQQMGVEPVRGADGRIDWAQTEQLARVQRDRDAVAGSLAARRAMGAAGPMTEEESLLTQTPAYQDTLTKLEIAKWQNALDAESRIQQIQKELEGRLAIEKEQNEANFKRWEKANEWQRESANRVRQVFKDPETGETTTLSFPASMAPQFQSGKTQQSDPRIKQIEKAIEDAKIAETFRWKIDVEEGPGRLPVIKRSRGPFFHSASPGNPESYRTVIDALEEQLRMAKEALGFAPQQQETKTDFLSNESVQGASSNSVRNAPRLDIYKYR